MKVIEEKTLNVDRRTQLRNFGYAENSISPAKQSFAGGIKRMIALCSS